MRFRERLRTNSNSLTNNSNLGPQSSRWVVLGVALAIQVSTSIVAAALPVLLPLVKSEFHLTFAQAGVLANFPYAGSFFTLALAGWAVDTLGDRVVLVVGGLVTGVAALATAIAPSLALVLVALLVMGAGISMPTPAGSIAVRGAFSLKLRGTVMGIRQTGIPIGSFFAAIALPPMALASGWRVAVAVAGAASIVIAVAGLRIYRSKPRPGESSVPSTTLLRVFNRRIAVAGLSGLLMVSGQMCLLTYLGAFLIRDRDLSITNAAFYLGLASLAGAFGRVLWGMVSDRFLSSSRRGALLMAGAFGAVGSIGLAILPNSLPFPFLVAAILLCATGAVGWNSVQVIFLSELAPIGSEGRGVGLGQMIQQPGILLGPFLFGWIVDATASFRPAWLLLAGFLLVAMMTIATVGESPQSRST